MKEYFKYGEQLQVVYCCALICRCKMFEVFEIIMDQCVACVGVRERRREAEAPTGTNVAKPRFAL